MTGTSERLVLYAGKSPPIRNVMKNILASRGVGMREFSSVDECRESLAKENRNLLVVVELNGDGARGLQLLAEMKQECPQISVLALVEHGDIPTAVQAMKGGAANCLEKPIETERLTGAIDELFDHADAITGYPHPPLTPMEITVLRHILEGKTSREIADTLHRSPRTIEVHRSHIMHKLGVSTMVDLIRTASALGWLNESKCLTSGSTRTSP